MKDNFIESIKPNFSSFHLNSFLESFDGLKEASQLAPILTKLGIQQDPDKIFDYNVSNDNLRQLQNTFHIIGRTCSEGETNDIEVKKMQGMQEKVRNLLSKKKNSIQLCELNVKREELANHEKKLKELSQKMQNHNAKESTLKEKFFIEEKARNENLKEQIKDLEKEFPLFEEVFTNEDLNNKISEINFKLKQFIKFKFDSSYSSPTSLSFSFDL